MANVKQDIGRLTPDKRAVLEMLLKKKRQESAAKIATISREGLLPLSFAQQRLWFLDRFEGESSVYNIPMSMRVLGAIDVNILERALSEIVRRHEALRTTFSFEEGRPVQKINEPVPVKIPVIDVASEKEADQRLNEEARALFDLSRGPLLRAKLLRLEPENHVLLLSMHHIVADGWSVGVLLAEMSRLYAAYAKNESSPLPELSVQYADWAAWQKQHVAGERYEKQLQFWRDSLAGAPAVIDLAPDRARPAVQRFEGRTLQFFIDKNLAQSVMALARELAATPFMTLLAAYSVLLSRRAGQEDLLIGTPIANRTSSETEPLIGCFINTLVMRAKPVAEKSFATLVEEVKETALDAYANQDLPFEGLIEKLQPERSLSHSPVFQAMFILQNAKRDPVAIPGLTVTDMHRENVTAKLDLTLSIAEKPDGFTCYFEYNTDLFDARTISRMAECFEELLRSAVAGPRIACGELNLLPASDRARLLGELRQTRNTPLAEESVVSWFASMSARTPQRIAVEYGARTMTYRELEQRSNGLAHRLRAAGVVRGTPVGVSLERGLDLAIALFGVMKAGGAYVPLDPAFPKARLELMIEDSGMPLAIGRDFAVDASVADAPPENGAEADGLAYVLYTSGSTGKPKGVEIRHRSLVSFLASMQHLPGMSAEDVLVAVTTISFDIAGLELYLPLVSGAKVVLASKEEASDGRRLLHLIERTGATIFQATPATWRLLLAAGFRLPSLTALVGGEAVPEDLADELFSRTARAFNVYGPTETTIWSTISEIDDGEISIGRPIDNTRVYITDPKMALVPVGVPGELLIGGEGLARGYRNRPELNEEKFVTVRGERLYRTGDRARMREDGSLEFLGRLDHQVKLRGFRIELGEIEAVLREQPGIAEAAVVLRDERLIAYYVARELVDHVSLRTSIKAKLPDYMIPAAFIVLDRFPLTPNLKIDRKALPEPGAVAQLVAAPKMAPRTPAEEILAALFAEVLGVADPSTDASFFHLGGHSLLATQLIARIRGTFGIELPLRVLFEAPTVVELAQHLASGTRSRPRIERIDRSKISETPLSFAQQRLWFLERFEGESGAYNIPLAYRLTGRLEISRLKHALEQLAARHETLRTTFPAIAGKPHARLSEVRPIELKVIEAHEEKLPVLLEREAKHTFDLAKDLPLRAQLLRLSPEEHVLQLSLHHVAADAWSLGLMLDELSALYSGTGLPPLPIQYADFAVWQRAFLDEKTVLEELQHWEQALHGAPLLLDPAADRPRPAVQRFEGGRFVFTIDPRVAEKLAKIGREESATLYMILLSAFSVLLSRRSGAEDLLIGSPIANRTQAEAEKLIGCFINTLVLRAKPEAQKSFRALLDEVKRTSLDAYAHQDLPFEMLIEKLAPERTLSHSPLFQVMFILQNAKRGELSLGECKMSSMPRGRVTAKYDLTLEMEESAGELTAAFEYNLDLYNEQTIARMAASFETLLAAITDDPAAKCGELAILPDAEKRRILSVNDTRALYPREQTIAQLFEAQAARTPERVAAVYGAKQLTYGELERRANGLAHRLAANGVKSGVTVGVALDRGLEMLIALFGIMKAGGAYVPLDPVFPRGRLELMKADSGMLLSIGEDLQLDESCADDPPELHGGAEELAYVLYTSGSTGKPKGVEIRHRSVVSFLSSMRHSPGLEASDVLVAVTTISFDIAALELYLPLISGAKVVVASREEAADGRRLLDLIQSTGATMLQATPATWRLLLAANFQLPQLTALVGGEALPEDLAKELFSRTKRAFNLYGPTETTIWSAISQVTGPDVTIGRPIANTQLFVTDAKQQMVPLGVPGELLIGGHGVARGYRNREELTREKFVRSPFAPLDAVESKLYRTGDRVRMREDGALEFLGRFDHQIKLRGFRIELGEIETVLAEELAIKEAVAVLKNERLVAYFVPCANETIEPAALRAQLKEKLPDYMIPSAFVAMERFPLTPNGKIDRARLPEPDVSATPNEHAFVEPRTELERSLAAIFGEILHVERVGVHDNFFDLGGHSLLAVTLLDRIETVLKKSLPLMALFRSPTVAEIAALFAPANSLVARPQALEELNNNGDRGPLFFIGSTPYARALIPYLGEDQPVYGMNIFGLYSEGDERDVDVAGVATEYVKEIRAKQPQGSYRIAAYCADTKLAMAVANELRRQNCTVSMLAFIDTIWSATGISHSRTRDLFDNLRDFGVSYLVQKVRRRVNMLRDYVAAKLRRRVIARLEREGKSLPVRVRHQQLIRNFLWAMHCYQPEQFPGKITLFLSQELRRRYPEQLDQIALGGLEIHEIPGFHDRVFVEPQINQLGQKLRDCLDRATRGE